ncbi:hypothetical protein [Mesorhizobium sp. M4B.F.Ca.ET.089.01.1.1]|uniref:hypothetical protein n=1 Tax=Mesorhizobium sp. M4B.F.Ca.ET.089.01.1.1 TaxID=2496662 RepID=UPI0032AF0798
MPFRSFEELRRRWPSIEKAAQQAEPEERKRRRETAKSSDAYKAAQLRNAERRRHRYPLPTEHLPPVGKPVATEEYGIVIFDEVSGELVEAEDLTASYPNAACANASYIWGRWRSATLSELIATWPARSAPKADKRSWVGGNRHFPN